MHWHNTCENVTSLDGVVLLMAVTHRHIKNEMVHRTRQDILYVATIKVCESLAVSVYTYVIIVALVF